MIFFERLIKGNLWMRLRFLQILRSGLVPLFTLILLFFAAGCAQKQQAVTVPPPPLSSQLPLPVVVEKKPKIIETATSAIGVPYRFGGTSPQTGFDCSGFVCWTYEQAGVTLPRRARDQGLFGLKVNGRENLQPGDIVVFKGMRSRTGWHSGIYTGDGKFVHSPSTGKTVTESRLDERYYAKRFTSARRIPLDGSHETLLASFYAERQALAAKSKKQPKNIKKMAEKKRRKPLMVARKTKRTASAKKLRAKNGKKPVIVASKQKNSSPAPGSKSAPSKTTKNSI